MCTNSDRQTDRQRHTHTNDQVVRGLECLMLVNATTVLFESRVEHVGGVAEGVAEQWARRCVVRRSQTRSVRLSRAATLSPSRCGLAVQMLEETRSQ